MKQMIPCRPIPPCLCVVAVVFSLSCTTAWSRRPIAIDGEFDDWSGVAANGNAKFTNDADRLYIYVHLGSEIWYQEDDVIELYFDTDTNPATGRMVNGIGAELSWFPGLRSGTQYSAGGSAVGTFGYTTLGMFAGPTLSSTEFEFAVARSTLSAASTISVVARESGAMLNATTAYSYQPTANAADLDTPFENQTGYGFRFASYNVKGTSDRPGVISQLQALQADIVAFQEEADHARALDVLNDHLGAGWQVAGNADVPVLSRFNVDGSWNLDSNVAVLLDTSAVTGGKLLVINVHLPCCLNESGRISEINTILSFLDDVRAGSYPVATNTPFVILGDFNLVGNQNTLDLILNGSAAPPDWDGTPLASVDPMNLRKRFNYTWRNDAADNYLPGKLDYVIVSDSVIAVENGFVLDTRLMDPGELFTLSLSSSDSDASDHLVVVADLVIDSDQDDMADSWELTFFSSLSPDGSADSDNDLASDLNEYTALTDPTSASDFAMLDFLREATEGTLSWQSRKGRLYGIEQTTDLDAAWPPAQGIVRGTDAEMLVPVPLVAPRAHYRLRISLPWPHPDE